MIWNTLKAGENFYATNISSFNQDPQQPIDGFPCHSIFPDKHEQEITAHANAGKNNRGTHNVCLDSTNSLFPSRATLQRTAADIGTVLNAFEFDELACLIGTVTSLFECIAQSNYVQNTTPAVMSSPSGFKAVPAWKTITPSRSWASSRPRITLPFS